MATLRGSHATTPLEQYRAYSAALARRLGPAEVRRHVLQRRRDRAGREMEYQTIELSRFGGG